VTNAELDSQPAKTTKVSLVVNVMTEQLGPCDGTEDIVGLSPTALTARAGSNPATVISFFVNVEV